MKEWKTSPDDALLRSVIERLAVLVVTVLAHGWRNGPAALALPLAFGLIWAIADPYLGIGASA